MRVTNNSTDQLWEASYAAYSDELERFVATRLDGEEAEDLLQETWAAFAGTLNEQDIGQPRAWLYRVVRNRITDLHRRASGRPAFQDLTPEIDAYEEDSHYPDPDATWADIEEALAELPAAQREVFVRNELDGETLREIAGDLGVSIKTVISRKGYARQRLQTLLQEVYDDYFNEE